MSRKSYWQRVDAYQGNYPKARKDAFRRSNGSCQFCGTKRPLEAHHWTRGFYPPGDRVTADDLTALCKSCHYIATCLRGMLHAGCSHEQLEAEFEQAVNDREKWQALLEWTSTAKSARNRMIELDAKNVPQIASDFADRDVGSEWNLRPAAILIAGIAILSWFYSAFY